MSPASRVIERGFVPLEEDGRVFLEVLVNGCFVLCDDAAVGLFDGDAVPGGR
jgi:hypothetical protein